jgi:hypothetical protein
LPARILQPANHSAFGSGVAATYTVAPPEGCVTPDLIFDGFGGEGRPSIAYTAVFAARRVA